MVDIKKDKKVKVEVKEVKNLDDDDDEKRLIVFVAIAVIVIIGVIIGLLVGCQKESKQEPVKPEEDIVIPTDDTEENENENKEETVTKVSTTSSSNDKTYTVTFYYSELNTTHKSKVKYGNKVSAYVPQGYENCKYYTNEELTNEFNFNNSIKSSKNIYAECEEIIYTIVYDYDNDNVSYYSISDGEVNLNDALSNELIFAGWYTESTFKNKVNSLTPSIIDYSNKSNEIHLYAKFKREMIIYYNTNTAVSITSKKYSKQELESVIVFNPVNEQACIGSDVGIFLGWTTQKGSKNIKYNENDVILLKDDLNLYAVCGNAKVVYASEGEVVEEVAYTTEELENYNLPTKEDLNMEAPTYYVIVESETETSKKVVEDSKETLEENEVKKSEVNNNKASKYESTQIDEGTYVEEHEKELTGWSQTDTDSTNEIPDGTEVKVQDDYIPPENETTELNAIWEEQEEDKPTVNNAPPQEQNNSNQENQSTLEEGFLE